MPREAKQSFSIHNNINKTSGETLPEQPGTQSVRTSRNRFTKSIDFPGSCTHRRKPFVPLKDLLQRNHDDRVREYLGKMKGLSLSLIHI